MTRTAFFLLSFFLAAVAESAERADFTAQERGRRVFQPLQPQTPPEVKQAAWARTEIDRFVLARLEQDNLKPAEEAPPAVLVRRVYFEVLGLPPSARETAAFLNDKKPGAWERLVNRLLADPRYGERQAQPWLDLVRYAESDGYKADDYRENAWRYRDWVIRAFNSDMPYDRFISLQLAGDELAPDDPEALTATGFLTHGIYEYNNTDAASQRAVILNEITDTAADVFMGLGLQCARCHDHKFDPLLQRDYYRLQAVFAPMMPHLASPLLTPDARREREARQAEWERTTAEVRAKIDTLQEPWREKARLEAVTKFAPKVQELLVKPEAQRTPLERQTAELAWRQVTYKWDRLNDLIKGEDKARLTALKTELAQFDSLKPPPAPTGRTIGDPGPEAPPVLIPRREKEGDIPPGAPVLFGAAPFQITTGEHTTGRRTALAHWLTQPQNPLTARVMVNRLWQQHFGRGLSGTPSDLGKAGDAPSHPELLDWLALRFMEDGWSLKKLHRLILTSAVWKQGNSSPSAEHARIQDPENRLLWQWRVRRLEAEQIRDAVLAATGELDATAGGPGEDSAKTLRRSIYMKVLRNARDPVLAAFDFPERINSSPVRDITTTATQALLLTNNRWVRDRAAAMSRALLQEYRAVSSSGDFIAEGPPMNLSALVETAWQRTAGRPPQAEEQEESLAFLQEGMRRPAPVTGQNQEPPAEETTIQDFCQALLTGSSMLYVE